MTTPAVNYDFLAQEFQQKTYNIDCFGNNVNIINANDGTTRYVKHRPASNNSPITSSGFRFPTGWYHWGLKATDKVSGTLKGWQVGLCGNPETRYYWINDNLKGISAGSIVSIPFLPTWVKDTAVSKAYTKLKGLNVNLGVMFAERHETAELFSTMAERIAHQVKRFKHKRPKDWAQVKKRGSLPEGYKVPQAWLELQYGWNPLMSDIQGSCTALSRRERDSSSYNAHVVGKTSTTQQRVVDWDYGWLQNGLFGQKITVIDTFDCTVRLWYRLNNPVLAAFSSLGLTNPLEIVWERVPYSFVIDWFLPVGNWLSTLDADFGWSFLAGCQTEFTRTKALGSPYVGSFVSIFGAENLTSPFKFDGFEMNRGGASVPPGVGLPHFKNPFSSTHIANAMSLLVQAFR